MKQFSSVLALSLVLVSGTVFAHDPPQKKTPPTTPAKQETMDHSKMDMQQDKVDHTKMDMSGKKPVDHGKTPDHQVMAKFVTLDRNSDGNLCRNEIPTHDALTERFHTLDVNKDGCLSKTEYAKHHDGM